MARISFSTTGCTPSGIVKGYTFFWLWTFPRSVLGCIGADSIFIFGFGPGLALPARLDPGGTSTRDRSDRCGRGASQRPEVERAADGACHVGGARPAG